MKKILNWLRILDETRNITHAADRLYMTQSALSKRIKSLEHEFGVELMIRSRQGIRFTPAGEKVLAHSKAATHEMEQLRRGLDSMQGEICGTLRAGVSVNYALYRLPEVLASYHKKYPMVRMDISTENGEPFVRRTYIFCQRDAAELPQVQLFMNALKKNR